MRTSIRTLVLAAGLMAPAAALAQPGSFTDLGTLTPGVPVTTLVPDVAVNTTAWYKITLTSSARLADLTYLEIYNSAGAGTGGSADSEIAVYNAAGTLLTVDDDDGAGTTSGCSFGSGSGTFLPSITGTPVVGNGRDGDLAAGDYYIGISYFGGSWGDGFTRPTQPGTLLYSNTLTIIQDAAPAAPEPGTTIDLGTLTYGTPINRTGDSLAANEVKWYKVVLPDATIPTGSYVDMDTEGTALTPSNTTRLSVYGQNGSLQSISTFAAANFGTVTMTDTTDGSASLSQLTFGVTTPARPAVGTGLAYNGRDGYIRAGTYFIAVAGVGVAPSTTAVSGTNFGHTSTSTNVGPIVLNLNSGAPSVNPSVTAGTAIPAAPSNGANVVLRVTAVKGANPTVPIGVTVDASAVTGVPGLTTLLDNGVAPDTAANDGVFAAQITIDGSSSGAYVLPVTVSDTIAPNRTGTGNINIFVVGPAPACPTGGSETFTFTSLDSEGPAGDAANGVGSFLPTGSDTIGSVKLTGRFLPNTSFSSETRIRIVLPSGAFVDYQPFATNTTSGIPVDLSEVTIPLPCDGIVANSGSWGVRIYESVTDAAVPDGIWTNLCVALVPSAGGGPNPIWTGDNCVADAGDLPATAQTPVGTGELTSIQGSIGTTTDVDMFLINICDISLFDANTAPGTADTQLWLFNLDGTGVMFNDDDTTVAGSSRLNNSGGQLTAPGNYYLAISRYNRDPVDVSAALLWNNTSAGGSFLGIRGPDGPGALNPVDSWVNTTGTGAYAITLAGTCYPSATPAGCNLSDITEIGGTAEAPGNPDNQLTVDDIIVFVNLFSDGSGCPGTAPCNRADVTGIGGPPELPDGQLTVDDIIAFFNAFSDGCPA